MQRFNIDILALSEVDSGPFPNTILEKHWLALYNSNKCSHQWKTSWRNREVLQRYKQDINLTKSRDATILMNDFHWYIEKILERRKNTVFVQ